MCSRRHSHGAERHHEGEESKNCNPSHGAIRSTKPAKV
jgi:hypothetical protein